MDGGYWIMHPQTLAKIKDMALHIAPFTRRRGIRGRKRALSVRRPLTY
jgi:hypothetical protein